MKINEIIIQKRDATSVPFSSLRIVEAVNKAELDVREYNTELGQAVSKDVMTQPFMIDKCVHIRQVQDAVEASLMQRDEKVARAYIEFRHDRDVARDAKSELIKSVKGLLEQTDESILDENANKDAKVIPTQRDLLAGILAKHYATKHLLPKEIVDAHVSGDIHYHDLDYAPAFPSFNCMLIDIAEMFKGFRMGNADIETPRSIETATAVAAQIIAQVASHIYGGCTINRIDEVFVPYVKATYNKHLQTAKRWGIENPRDYAKDLTENSCYRAFKSLEYEINTLHSANGQTPFVTLGFGLGTTWESVTIQKAILKVRIKGLGKKAKTAIFPKLLLAIKEGVNRSPEDPNYEVKQLALECASKRMYPDILNYPQVVEKTGSFKTPMGCRSFLDEFYNEVGELEHSGRNNLGVVSLNLPRIALESKGKPDVFARRLQEQLLLARRALETRLDRFKNVKARVAPILYMEGACGVRLNADDNVIDIFKNGRASISLGYIGLHEAIIALYGNDKHIFDNKALQGAALWIVRTMKEAVESWRVETGWGYSLYATPSENLCSRFLELDRKKFGVVPGVTDKDYYTNSFHLDVAKKVNPYDKLDFEKAYPKYSSGGFICYGEFPNMQHNLKALEDVWDYSYNLVPYYGTNTPIDECYECGFTGEFLAKSKGFVCPSCGCSEEGKISVTRRVCGYLGTPDARPFNKGKQDEVKSRVKHLD